MGFRIQGVKQDAGSSYEKMQNAKIDPNEWQGSVFACADKNHDGKLTKKELEDGGLNADRYLQGKDEISINDASNVDVQSDPKKFDSDKMMNAYNKRTESLKAEEQK